MNRNNRAWVRAVALALAAAGTTPLGAEVVDSSDTGFLVRSEFTADASPREVYRALAHDVRHWWDPEHTWSGDAANLRIAPRAGGCFCESIPGGDSVQHAVVVYESPGKLLRLHGALGPLQGSGLSGSLTWTIEEGDAGTHVVQTYSVGGYWQGGFSELAPVVDSVMSGQLDRLRRHLNK